MSLKAVHASNHSLHLDKCKGGYEYILLVVDHYTRFAQAYATTSKFAKTVADFNDYAHKFGFYSPALCSHESDMVRLLLFPSHVIIALQLLFSISRGETPD